MSRRRRSSPRRSSSSACRRSLMSWSVITTPSIRSSVVRYGRSRTRTQRPSRVSHSRSTMRSSLEHALQVVEEVGRSARLRGDVGERPAQVGSQQVEHSRPRRREQLHAQAAVQEDRADVARVDQVLEVVVGEPELLDLDLQLLVDRRQLLVDRLQLLLAGLELLGRRAQLLVHRLQLFVRRLGLLDLGLVLLDGDAQLLAQPANLLLELLRQRLRRPGQLRGGDRRRPPPRGRRT